MKQAHLAKKYARAFVARIAERADAVSVLAELEQVAGAIQEEKSLRDFFHSPLFTVEEKLGALKTVAGKAGLSEEVQRTLERLVAQNRFHLLRDVVAYAAQILNEHLKKTEAEVVSAIPLSEEVLARLREALRKITGRDPELETAVDPSILGGLRVKVGSVLYDGSLRGQLENLREELIKG